MENKNIIKYPLATEKSIRLMEAENKLVFIVDNKATKTEIKTFVEKMFKVKVDSVNTLRTVRGIKKAYVKLTDVNPAIDVATQLGLM